MRAVEETYGQATMIGSTSVGTGTIGAVSTTGTSTIGTGSTSTATIPTATSPSPSEDTPEDMPQTQEEAEALLSVVPTRRISKTLFIEEGFQLSELPTNFTGINYGWGLDDNYNRDDLERAADMFRFEGIDRAESVDTWRNAKLIATSPGRITFRILRVNIPKALERKWPVVEVIYLTVENKEPTPIPPPTTQLPPPPTTQLPPVAPPQEPPPAIQPQEPPITIEPPPPSLSEKICPGWGPVAPDADCPTQCPDGSWAHPPDFCPPEDGEEPPETVTPNTTPDELDTGTTVPDLPIVDDKPAEKPAEKPAQKFPTKLAVGGAVGIAAIGILTALMIRRKKK